MTNIIPQQSQDGNLAADGKAQFSADEIPSGSSQSPIYAGGHDIEVTITWKSV